MLCLAHIVFVKYSNQFKVEVLIIKPLISGFLEEWGALALGLELAGNRPCEGLGSRPQRCQHDPLAQKVLDLDVEHQLPPG